MNSRLLIFLRAFANLIPLEVHKLLATFVLGTGVGDVLARKFSQDSLEGSWVSVAFVSISIIQVLMLFTLLCFRVSDLKNGKEKCEP